MIRKTPYALQLLIECPLHIQVLRMNGNALRSALRLALNQDDIHCYTGLRVLFPSARTVSPYSIRTHPPVRSRTELIIKSCFKKRVSETRLEV